MSQTEVQLIKSNSVVDGDIVGMSSSKLSGTLPAVSAANLTNIPAANLTGALPAISGASLTNLPASGKTTNLIINGAMNIAQRQTSTTAQGYVMDRFAVYYNGLDENSTYEQGDVTSGGAYNAGFRKCLKITNGNQTSGAQAASRIFAAYNVEARDMATSGWNYTSSSSNITLSFWVKASVSKSYYGYLYSFDGTNRRYAFETGTLTANTWTKITKTIPGDSNLQFDNDIGSGLYITFGAYWGTSYTDSGVALNQWGSWDGAQRVPVDGTSWYTTNDATFELTGVQLEVGDSASDFVHESHDETLKKCKRYCHVLASVSYDFLGLGMQYYSGSIFISAGAIDMRTTPTLVAKSGSSGAYVYEKLFGNSAQYIHQIALDGKTNKHQAVLNMSGDNTRQGEVVRCSAHSATLSNNEPFVYLTAEL